MVLMGDGCEAIGAEIEELGRVLLKWFSWT